MSPFSNHGVVSLKIIEFNSDRFRLVWQLREPTRIEWFFPVVVDLSKKSDGVPGSLRNIIDLSGLKKAKTGLALSSIFWETLHVTNDSLRPAKEAFRPLSQKSEERASNSSDWKQKR